MGSNFLEQLQPFRTDLVIDVREACRVAAGLRQVGNKTRADGIGNRTNIIGTVCVTRCNAVTAGVAVAKITSGDSATNSVAAFE
jgi:hypothetical protein